MPTHSLKSWGLPARWVRNCKHMNQNIYHHSMAVKIRNLSLRHLNFTLFSVTLSSSRLVSSPIHFSPLSPFPLRLLFTLPQPNVPASSKANVGCWLKNSCQKQKLISIKMKATQNVWGNYLINVINLRSSISILPLFLHFFTSSISLSLFSFLSPYHFILFLSLKN